MNPWTGTILDPPNMGPRFRDVPLAAELEARFGLPVFLDRDTNVAALGEQAFGAARDCTDFLYITVSTGIGGGIVSGGRLVHGPDGTAGEVGHLPVELAGPVCGCGGTGHLEAVASGVALARDARAAVAAASSPFLAARAETHADGPAGLTARDVAEGDEAGDPTCTALMERARRAIAVVCAGLINLLDPDRIVIGGSIAEHQGDRLLAPVRAEVQRATFQTPRARVQIVSAALGRDVSLAGGQPLVHSRLDDPSWRRGRAEPLASTTI